MLQHLPNQGARPHMTWGGQCVGMDCRLWAQTCAWSVVPTQYHWYPSKCSAYWVIWLIKRKYTFKGLKLMLHYPILLNILRCIILFSAEVCSVYSDLSLVTQGHRDAVGLVDVDEASNPAWNALPSCHLQGLSCLFSSSKLLSDSVPLVGVKAWRRFYLPWILRASLPPRGLVPIWAGDSVLELSVT